MKKIFFVLFLMYNVCYPQSGWEVRNSGTNYNLLGVDCIDSEKWIAVGSGGTILRTTDAGNTWTSVPSGIANTLNSIKIIEENIAVAVGSGGIILRTSDGGLSWDARTSNTTNNLVSVDFFNTQNGITVARGGWYEITILKTTNGGLTWDNISQNNIYQTNVLKVCYPDSNRILIFFNSSFNCYNIISTDNGNSWTEYMISGFGSNGSITDVSFFDAQKGYVVAWGVTTNQYYGLLFKTINGGQFWTDIDLPAFLFPPFWFYSLEYINSSTLIVSGKWRDALLTYKIGIIKSTNNGISWFEQESGVNQILRDITFFNDTIGIAVGDSGTIIRTTNGGVSFLDTENISGQPSGFSLKQNYPNPFNPSTTIKYQIPEMSFVTIIVFDILGREVATLVNKEKPAGSYEVQFSSHSVEGGNLPAGRQGLTSGIYFYQLKANDYVETKKMILLK